MSINVRFEDNSPKFERDWKEKKKKILYAIGLKWQSLCTQIITRNRIILTGRLRGSLTFITPNKIGKSISSVAENKQSDYLTGSAPEDSLIVGSNLSYASKQELTNPKGAFVKPSILNYRDTYKNIAKQIMEE